MVRDTTQDKESGTHQAGAGIGVPTTVSNAVSISDEMIQKSHIPLDDKHEHKLGHPFTVKQNGNYPEEVNGNGHETNGNDLKPKSNGSHQNSSSANGTEKVRERKQHKEKKHKKHSDERKHKSRKEHKHHKKNGESASRKVEGKTQSLPPPSATVSADTSKDLTAAVTPQTEIHQKEIQSSSHSNNNDSVTASVKSQLHDSSITCPAVRDISQEADRHSTVTEPVCAQIQEPHQDINNSIHQDPAKPNSDLTHYKVEADGADNSEPLSSNSEKENEHSSSPSRNYTKPVETSAKSAAEHKDKDVPLQKVQPIKIKLNSDSSCVLSTDDDKARKGMV